MFSVNSFAPLNREDLGMSNSKVNASIDRQTASILPRVLSPQRRAKKDVASHTDSLNYAIKRLVRGTQSSRQCARQGFSLGLARLAASVGAVAARARATVSRHRSSPMGGGLLLGALGSSSVYRSMFHSRSFDFGDVVQCCSDFDDLWPTSVTSREMSAHFGRARSTLGRCRPVLGDTGSSL